MNMITCPNCGQPIGFLGHQCPYCHIRIVGASGLSKLMRELGNSPMMLAGGLFVVAFFLCILILWKIGMIESKSVESPSKKAANGPTLRIGPGASTSPGRDEKGRLSGKWTGKFINTLGDSSDAELTIQEEAGRSISGQWNGNSLLKAKRAEDNLILWECSQRGETWKYSCRFHENSLLDVTFQALAQNSEGAAPPSGSAFLFPEGAGQPSRPDAAAYSGLWSGFYSAGPDSGITTLRIQQDKSGTLSGVWNGNARITQAKLSGRFLECECEKGATHYRNISALRGDGSKLVLIFSVSQESDENSYCGSALYTRNP